MDTSRRRFLKGSALGLAASSLPTPSPATPGSTTPAPALPVIHDDSLTLDLTPAKWVWYRSGRCLQNTCVLFRKTVDLPGAAIRVSGWLTAESRYKLFVNGHYVQFGPAPSDPRYSECDPMDAITPFLCEGPNVLAVQALYFGQGDGTWPLGKPGLICKLEIETLDGKTLVVSDHSWRAMLARTWKPGQYKRWYLRALQEERDERLFPKGGTRSITRPESYGSPCRSCRGVQTNHRYATAIRSTSGKSSAIRRYARCAGAASACSRRQLPLQMA